ncbi:unnamed protein product [Laminaria digitata]
MRRRGKGKGGEDPTSKIKSETKKKSCDSCAVKKRKCDGGNPCRLCFGSGDACSYSKRRPRSGGGQRPPPAAALPTSSVGWASDRSMYGGSATLPAERDPCAHESTTLPAGRGEWAALQQYGSVSLKRCRLSASPATGLVGMRENGFLSDYFGCFSFLPFTSQSNIRETMVKIFAGSVRVPPPSDSGDYSTTDQHFNAIIPADNRLPVDPSTCVFWSAIALGSLVQGRPVESVEKYCRLARDALANVSGPPSTEVARAWAILAYMSDFCGDHANLHVYLKCANDVLCDVGEEDFETLPTGLAEVVKHGATVKLFVGDLDGEEVESFCNEQRDHPQMSEAATEGDICQFVMRSFRSLERAIYENVREDQATAHGRADGGDRSPGIASGGATGAAALEESHPHFLACLVRDQGPAPCPSSILDIMRKMMRKHASEFNRIEHVAAGPNIRGGIGGLIINGTLVFEKAARKDVMGALEKLTHCGDVLERYPGLCRFTMGAHMTHMLLANLVLIDGSRARGIYDQMMTAYNSARSSGVQAIPPFDEWEGVTHYCDNYYCRVIEQTVAREYSNSSSCSPPQDPAAEMPGKGPHVVPVHGGQKRGVSPRTGSRERAEASFADDTQPRHQTFDASRPNREPERLFDEEPVGCLLGMSSEGWRGGHAQPPEPTLSTPLSPKVVSEPMVDSDVCHIVDEQSKPSSYTEVGAQATEALLLSELSTEGTATVDETGYDAGIGVADWLDVTHALLYTSGH